MLRKTQLFLKNAGRRGQYVVGPLSQKYDGINNALSKFDQQKLTPRERQAVLADLKQLISSAWQTDEIRHNRPTPVDEAKWGFTTIEQTLWNAVPKFVRELNELVQAHCENSLPLEIAPIRFASWMGGDRDGNPNVTHSVTQEVLWLSRWQAADLYLRDIEDLRWELSIQACSDELKQALEKVLSDPTVGIVLLTEKFGQEFPDIIDTFRLERKMPLLIEIPDRHGTGRQKDFITSYITEAIGLKL